MQKITPTSWGKMTSVFCLFFSISFSLNAATFTVTNSNDVGAGSLRQAILDANAAATNDIINFSALFNSAQTIVLGGTELTIANNGTLTINGPGADLLTVSGNNASRVFGISTGATAAMGGLTIAGGNSGGGNGGGILNQGTLTLNQTVVKNNFSAAVSWAGNPTAGGAGIHNSGSLNITNSLITSNSTNVGVSNSSNGGGILNAGSLMATNLTISGNIAGNGGGVYQVQNGPAPTVTLENVTLTGNSTIFVNGGANLWIQSGTLFLRNCIVANKIQGLDCGNLNGSTVDIKFSLIEDGSCITPGTNGNISGDPNLGLLQNNGGPTQTHALLACSPALNAADPSDTLTTDQRGFVRPFGGRSDIGAVEMQSALSPQLAVYGNNDTLSDGQAATSSSDSTDFGSLVLGNSETHGFYLANNGDAALSISTIQIMGTDAAQFSATPSSGNVAAGDSLLLQITYNPTAAGSHSATVEITFDACNVQVFDFAISGEALAPQEISVSGNSQNITDGQTAISKADNTDFDSTGLAEPVVKDFLIENTGQVDLDVSNISLSGSGAFQILSATSATISGGNSSVLQIQFTPPSVGTFSATVSIDNNDADENPFTFAIEGKGFVNNAGPCAPMVTGSGAPRPSPFCP